MEIVKDPGNDHEAILTHLVETYEVLLFRTCYMYLRDRESAEDAVQETFLKAYKALPAFRGDCSEKTWLMKIAVNVCRDIRRSSWIRMVDRRASLDLLPEPVQEYDGWNSLDLAGAIMQLPVKWKEVVLLYFYHDMTMREIGEALGVSASVVSKRIKQACAKLENILGRGYLHG
ncbi:MAG: sigma-70 family RNA polymerase sigma factor [Clostridia bacterium]|nr:sigma-70 family RNA polymerase sigma factor [Clostridia bacterium]